MPAFVVPCVAGALALLSSGPAQSPAPPSDERAAVAALSTTPAPSAFPIEVNALAMPVPGHPGQTAVFVRVPGGSLTFGPEPKTGMFNAGAVVVARFVDSSGAVLAQASQLFPMRGLLPDAKATLARPIEFFRIYQLVPGPCRLQVAVYDQHARQATVTTVPFEAPPLITPIVGSLMIVDRAQKVPADQPEDPANPFIVSHVLLHPAYDAGVNRGIQPILNFILPIVLTPGTTPPPATLSLLRAGQPVASIPLPLAKAEPDGRLMAVGRIPLEKVPPGKYQLQVAVGTGADARVRAAPLTVVG